MGLIDRAFQGASTALVSAATIYGEAVSAFAKARRFDSVESTQSQRETEYGKAHEIDEIRERMKQAQGENMTSRPGAMVLDFPTLRQLATVPVCSAIIGTRVHEFGEFCVPQESPYGTGFVVRLRERRRPPTRIEAKRAEELMRWVNSCGDPKLGKEESFEVWGRKTVRDSLIYDQRCSEIIFSNGGKPLGWKAVDAATIRRARLTDAERQQGQRDTDDGFVQIVNDKIVATFEHDEMMFGVRRPRTLLAANGYGYPELEVLVGTVARIVNAETFNAVNFTSGVHASGILALKSRMSNKLFRVLQTEVYEMLQGVSASKRVPFIKLDPSADEDIKAVSLSRTNQEMEYREWISWLLRVICAEYQMDPAELGFVYGNEGQKTSMNAAPAGERITASKERGLRPLLRGYEAEINQKLLWNIAPDFEFAFAGYGAQTEAQRIETDGKAVRTFVTVNEIRAEHDRPPLTGVAAVLGDCPLDPTLMTAVTQILTAQSTTFPGAVGTGIQPMGLTSEKGSMLDEAPELRQFEDDGGDVGPANPADWSGGGSAGDSGDGV